MEQAATSDTNLLSHTQSRNNMNACVWAEHYLVNLIYHVDYILIFQLKLYGGQEEILGIPKYPEFIGYTLPATSVTSRIIPVNSSGVIFANLYSVTLCFLYSVIICFLTVYYYHSRMLKKRIDDLINKDTDLSKGIRITTNTAIVIEFSARLVSCIVWTLNIDNLSGVILVVWMPQIHLLMVIVVQNSFGNIYMCHQEKGSGMSCKEKYEKSELRIFSNMCASTFALFYVLNPAVILTFVYPAQIIVIYTSVTAYLFATTIFSASIIKLNRRLTKKRNKDNHQNDKENQKNISQCNEDKINQPVHWTKRSFKILIFIILWLVVVYLHFLLVLTSYLLLIGKSSVINSTPSFIISLVPSILISGGAWFAKKVTFETEVENVQVSGKNVDTNGKE